jgi:F-box protein 11
MNECFECYENGIVTIAKKEKHNNCKVWYNFCERNKENGVLCSGLNNQTRVEKNCMLSNNMKAGVCAIDEASIIVSNNRITGNFGQGVLLVESTYAHIEKNIISANYKANIAFGGGSACDTVIINNEITESRQEGIFCIEAGFSWIYKNDISDNSDGIVMFDSSPHIAHNEISVN